MNREKYLKTEIKRIKYKIDMFHFNYLDDFDQFINLLDKYKNELKILQSKKEK